MATVKIDIGGVQDLLNGVVAWTVDKYGPAMIQLYMEQAANAYSWKDAKTLSTAAYVAANKLLDGYESRGKGVGFGDFRLDWKKLRLCVALQARLIIEQALYDRGEPWSRLCFAGFRPLE